MHATVKLCRSLEQNIQLTSSLITDNMQCKNFENWLRFDKVTESLKVGTFLRHSVGDLILKNSVLVHFCILS